MVDVIVVGAGIGGLVTATRVAKHGLKVLLLEKIHHIGGTGHTFQRGSYKFPVGPLAFTHPDLVRKILAEIGMTEKLAFTREHFQLISPAMNLVYSRPLRDLQSKLKKIYPDEAAGIDDIFKILVMLARTLKDIHRWHPDYTLAEKYRKVDGNTRLDHGHRLQLLEHYVRIPCREFLKKYIADERLRRFLGSQGTGEPEMSMALLATMWHLMSEVGIWCPSGGIERITNLIYKSFVEYGGQIRLNAPVVELSVKTNRISEVRTADGGVFRARWVVSNADYKKTFLELIKPGDVPAEFLRFVRETPFSGSELCVYLGLNPDRADFTKIRAQHLFFRKEFRIASPDRIDDFDNREIEMYLLSRDNPEAAPPGKFALMLRSGMPYAWFSAWKTGEKKRKKGYREFKENLARKLIQTVESLVPGLSESVDIMDVATPLTYEDWGQRFQGSIAGWSWEAVEPSIFPGKLMIKTPIDNLLMAGVYTASELFLGGVPTSMVTAWLASDVILNRLKDG